MADNASPFRIYNQPPLIQLAVSFFIVIIAGTLLFYLFIYTGSLIFGTSLEKMLQIPDKTGGANEYLILRYVQVSQHFALFIIPSLVIIYSMKKGGESITGMQKLPDPIIILLVIVLAMSIIPVTTFTGILNSKMSLPGWFPAIEEKMRTMEDTASKLTKLLITSTGLGSLIGNIFIVAIIPAFGEELLFRGVVQQLLCKIFKSSHLGIWITALIFSTIHFQFFGFIPRLILGLSFGYLFFWTRNLWVPILAHFINNVVPVVIAYYSGRKEFNTDTSYTGGGKEIVPFISLIICGFIFFYIRKEYLKKGREKSLRQADKPI
jgi:membrane protease YdiL (CAAX protease family)